MNVLAQILLAVIGIGVVSVVVYRAVRAYRRYGDRMLVTCPENREPAGVVVDAGAAAVTAASSEARLVLTDCTRWPEMRNCGQECLAQIELSPEDCQVRTILSHWFEGRACAYCGREFHEIHWHDHKPVLIAQDGRFVEWRAVPVEQLPGILETHRAACYDCFVAETFRREHPELVTDRRQPH